MLKKRSQTKLIQIFVWDVFLRHNWKKKQHKIPGKEKRLARHKKRTINLDCPPDVYYSIRFHLVNHGLDSWMNGYRLLLVLFRTSSVTPLRINIQQRPETIYRNETLYCEDWATTRILDSASIFRCGFAVLPIASTLIEGKENNNVSNTK